ncbi:phage portal protein [Fodinicola feengrottensis]|nr:phage portal protein [Fodinicola feengrottensis]
MLDIKTLGSTQRDSQFIQQMIQAQHSISIAFGVPVSKLGDASERTYSNAGQEHQNFWFDTILPLVSELQDHINLRLAPLVGSEAGWFDTSGVVELQPKRNITAVSVTELKQANLITDDEARDYIGLPAGMDPAKDEQPSVVSTLNLAQAAVALVDAGYDPAAALDAVGLPPMAWVGPPFTSSPAPVAIPTGQVQASDDAGEQRHAGPDHAPVPTGHLTKGMSAAYLEAKKRGVIRDAHVASLTRAMTKQAHHMLDRQARSVRGRLEGKRGRLLVEKRDTTGTGIYDPIFWVEEVRQWASAMYEMALALAAGADQVDPGSVDQFIEARSDALAATLTEEIHRAVSTQFQAGLDADEDHERVVERINSSMSTLVIQRSEELAQMEAVLAYDGAAELVSGVDASTVGQLLTQMAANEIDLDQALAALNGKAA